MPGWMETFERRLRRRNPLWGRLGGGPCGRSPLVKWPPSKERVRTMRRAGYLIVFVASAFLVPLPAAAQGGQIQKPGEIQQPKGTWQVPGEIRQPTGPWRTPGEFQKPGQIQLIREQCQQR